MKTQEIYRELRDRICFLTYPPGSRLGEIELANEFYVSRTPIRGVLAQLEAQGLVKARRGVGTIVTEIEPEALLQTLELRKEMALLLCQMSPVEDARPLSRGVTALMRQCQVRGDTLTVTEFAKLNAKFFELIQQISGNAALREVTEKLYYLTARLWVHSIPKLNLRDEIGHFIAEMTDVYMALQRNDVRAVGHIRWLYLTGSIDRQAQHFRSSRHAEKLAI